MGYFAVLGKVLGNKNIILIKKSFKKIYNLILFEQSFLIIIVEYPSEADSYSRALECALNHTLQCLPFEYRDYYPQPHKMKDVARLHCFSASIIGGE